MWLWVTNTQPNSQLKPFGHSMLPYIPYISALLHGSIKEALKIDQVKIANHSSSNGEWV